MNVEELRLYCLSLPGVTERMPWMADRVYSGGLVFYIGGKWFCFTNVDNFRFVNVKLPPNVNDELRCRYEAVRPGWHMNKRHWSSVYIDSDLADEQIFDIIRLAYNTVFAALPLKERRRIAGEGDGA